jgi:hypothetical protein
MPPRLGDPGPSFTYLERLGLRPTMTIDDRGRRVPLLRLGVLMGGRDVATLDPALIAVARRSIWRSISPGSWVSLSFVVVIQVFAVSMVVSSLHLALTRTRFTHPNAWVAPAIMIPLGFLAVFATWRRIKGEHADRLAAALVNQVGCCASCGYALRGLAADPGDGCIVCPECQAAWRRA